MKATCLLFLTISCAALTQGQVTRSLLMKKSLGRCRSAGFQPAIPLGSSKAGKMPALQRVSRDFFISLLVQHPNQHLGEFREHRERPSARSRTAGRRSG